MRIKLVDTREPDKASALAWLQAQVFPSDEALDTNFGWWWMVWDYDVPVAFAAMREVPSWEGSVYMARCGVLKSYRGLRLQKRLLLTRERFAKASGFARAITTTYRNPPSANNLIRAGYLTYTPQRGWGAPDTIYWLKEFQ